MRGRKLKYTLSQKIGLRLRQIRMENGLRQCDLETNGVDQKIVSKVEYCYDHGVSVKTVEKVVAALGITVKEFFDSEIFGE